MCHGCSGKTKHKKNRWQVLLPIPRLMSCSAGRCFRSAVDLRERRVADGDGTCSARELMHDWSARRRRHVQPRNWNWFLKDVIKIQGLTFETLVFRCNYRTVTQTEQKNKPIEITVFSCRLLLLLLAHPGTWWRLVQIAVSCCQPPAAHILISSPWYSPAFCLSLKRALCLVSNGKLLSSPAAVFHE